MREIQNFHKVFSSYIFISHDLVAYIDTQKKTGSEYDTQTQNPDQLNPENLGLRPRPRTKTQKIWVLYLEITCSTQIW